MEFRCDYPDVMVLILGVHKGADSGAALLDRGLVIAAANEERFNRQKLFRGFPYESVRYVLDRASTTLSQVDRIAVGAYGGIDQYTTLPILTERLLSIQPHDEFATSTAEQRIRVSLLQDREHLEGLISGLKMIEADLRKVDFFDHHLAHACSSYFLSPFENALTLVVDGRGDFKSTSLWVCTPNSRMPELVHVQTELESVGAMYGFVTNLLGFQSNRHEGKVSGLAAFGRSSDFHSALQEGIWFDDVEGRIKSKLGENYSPFATAPMPKLAKLLNVVTHADAAFAAQQTCTDIVRNYLSHHASRLRERIEFPINLCLAGGVVGNVRMNMELRKLDFVKDVFVTPAMHDGGCALGAALACHAESSEDPSTRVPMSLPYWGPEFDEQVIIAALTSPDFQIDRFSPANFVEEVSTCLERGQVVGLFQGRMEFGPRALGNRSIIARANNADINQSLNLRLNRTEFMPFAPSTTFELAAECFIGWDEYISCSSLMTMCFEVTRYFHNRCPAAVHVDGTARPQVVRRKDNPIFHEIIQRNYEKTGEPAVINTSFNYHEEPIVLSPFDAVKALRNGWIDCLAMLPFVAHVRPRT